MNTTIDQSSISKRESLSSNGSDSPALSLEDRIGNLQVSTVELFIKIWDSPDRTSFVSKRENSASLGVLIKNDFIRPMGKVGEKTRWQCQYEKFNRDIILLMRQIARL